MIKHKDKDFEKWLNEELDKPSSYSDYDPADNSTKAMVTRYRDSKWKSLIWHYKDLWGDVVYGWKHFNLDTGIGDVFGLLFFTLMFPLGGVLRLYFDTKYQIKQYYQEYQEKKDS